MQTLTDYNVRVKYLSFDDEFKFSTLEEAETFIKVTIAELTAMDVGEFEVSKPRVQTYTLP